MTITPEDRSGDLALIEELAPRFKVPSDWAMDLYRLVSDRYGSLDSPSGRRQLQEEVIKIVENAVQQADRDDANRTDSGP